MQVNGPLVTVFGAFTTLRAARRKGRDPRKCHGFDVWSILQWQVGVQRRDLAVSRCNAGRDIISFAYV